MKFLTPKQKNQGLAIGAEMVKAGIEELKEFAPVRIFNNVLCAPVRRLCQIEAEHKQALFIQRVFDGEPTEEDWKKLEDSGEASTFAEIFKHVTLEDEVHKSKLYGECCKAIINGLISEHDRRDFIRAVKELSFKDFDFLVQFINCLPKALKYINHSIQKLPKEQQDERCRKALTDYMRVHTVNQGHAASVNRLVSMGALTLANADMPSKATTLGENLRTILQEVIAEVAEDVIDAYWEKHKHNPLKRFDPRDGRQWVEDAPPDGWSRDDLKHMARPWLTNFRNYDHN